MAVDDKKQPIVVKKIKKGGGGHHGGAWKVAYADFVTAMMAFFLLLWLLGSTSEKDREIISDVFANPSAVQGPGGASTSMIKLGGAMEVPKGEGKPMEAPTPDELAEDLDEQAKLDELMKRIKEQIEKTPSLIDFKDQLKIDITVEGLRIQIVDKENRPMFDLGSAQLKWYMKTILKELGKTIATVPNHVSVSGHTDATVFYGDRPNYTNWELSADRANAARRELKTGGLPISHFGRVVGLASSVPYNKEDPKAPVNRRISIIVLNRATEMAIGLDRLPDPIQGEKVSNELSPPDEPNIPAELPLPDETSTPEEIRPPEDLFPPPLPNFNLPDPMSQSEADKSLEQELESELLKALEP